MSARTDAAPAALPRGTVDTHCHLVLLDERGLLDESLAAASGAGVEQIISVGLDVDDSDRNRVLAERLPGVFFTVGWHPTQPTPPDRAQLHALAELADHPRCVAVGEIGLDAYFRPGYHETPLAVQEEGMRLMVDLAAAHDLPVVVHDRDAHEAVLRVLVDGGARGAMHCFSGDADFGRRCEAVGMALSFSGIVTFPRSDGIQAAATAARGESVLVETDAPFLAPVPFRGRPNQPAYVAATAAAVARLRGVEPQSLADQAAANARRIFRLPAEDRLPS